MGIFLRHSWNVKPPRWGSPADVQYAIRVNSEKIYDIDPDNDVFVMPGFWGLPPLDYSGYNNNGTNYGATYKDRSWDFVELYIRVIFGGDAGIDMGTINSASVWVNFSSLSSIQVVIAHKSYLDGYLLGVDATKLYYIAGTGAAYSLVSVTHGLSTGQWTNLAVSRSGTTVKFYKNGQQLGAAQTLTDNFIVTVSTIGAYYSGASSTSSLISEIRISNVSRTADQVSLFYDRPWDLYRPVSRPVWSIPTGAYTITAVKGSYSITGQTVNLLRNSIVSSEAGSIALSGLSTNLLKGFVLGAGAGSITLTGFSTDLLKGSLIGAEAGSIVLTGQDVTLVYSGGAYVLAAGSGSIALTGTQVDLLRAGRLPSGAGSIILTGTNVDLLRGFLLGAEAGSYTLTGTAATLLRAAKLGVDSGTYDLVGFNVGLNYSEEEWKKIILRGLDVLSGQLVNITGQYKEI